MAAAVMRQWRLIFSNADSGARNMAIDEALLLEVVDRPVLRFYGWQPHCLSLGYGQRSAIVDRERLRARGCDLVRRASGGGAILHTQELTWCLVLPPQHPLATLPHDAGYRRIAAVLMDALSSLGIPVSLQQRGDAVRPDNQACFATPARHELLVDGRKLLGSARVRRRHGLLQHGSLPLAGDLAAICDLLRYPDEQSRARAAAQLRARALTLSEAAGGRPVAGAQVAAAIASAFCASQEVDLVESELTAAENRRTDSLEATRYGKSEWTCRR